MTRSWGWRSPVVWLLASVALGGIALIASIRPEGASEGSVLSRRPRGWRAARAYIEARGRDVVLLDRPAREGVPEVGALAVVFPHRLPLQRHDREALRRFVWSGGTLVVGTSGRRLLGRGGASALAEEALLRVFGIAGKDIRDAPPLWPTEWRAWAAQEWETVPAGDANVSLGAGALRVEAPTRVVVAPSKASVWQTGPENVPVALDVPAGRGRVVLLPSDALSNRRLGQAGNAALLESLLRETDGNWAFAEYHHGFVGADAPAALQARFAFEGFLLQALLVYLLAVAAMIRSFGPAWSDPPIRVGSTASFLQALAERHQGMRHYRAAGHALLERAGALDPHVSRSLGSSGDVGDGAGLVKLARSVASLQRPPRQWQER